MLKLFSSKYLLQLLVSSKLTILLVILFSLIVSFAVWSFSKTYYEQVAKDKFESVVLLNLENIDRRMKMYESFLRSGIAFFKGSDYISREDWHDFVQALEIEKYYPGVQGIGFAKMLKANEVANFEKQMSKIGFQGVKLKPAGKRQEYSGIMYLEPLDKRNLEAIGYDMFSEKRRREAMQIARDTGKTSITAKLTLVQEIDSDVQSGMLMYLPLYKEGATLKTPEEHRKALVGFVYSPFRMGDLMENVVQQASHLNFKVYDGNITSPQHLLYKSKGNHKYQSKFSTEVTLKVNNREWHIFFSSTPTYDRVSESHYPLLITIVGLIVNFFLFMIIIALLKSRYQLLVQLEKNHEQASYMVYQSRLAQMGEMLSMIAHQWRQPLASISTITGTMIIDLAMDEYDSELFQEELGVINELSQYLSSTIDDFRCFFKKNKEKEEVNLKEMIESTLHIIKLPMEAKGIELSTQYYADRKIFTYVNEVKQVLLNILKNSQDVFKEKNITNPKILITTNADDQYVYIFIEDNGGGIPDKVVKKIFDPYFSTKTSQNGTGLGLYMSKMIIEEHCGGELSASNTESGTILIIKLPIEFA